MILSKQYVLGANFGIYEFLLRMYLLFYSIKYIIIAINEKKKSNLIFKLITISIFILFLYLDETISIFEEVLDLINLVIKFIMRKRAHLIVPILQIFLIYSKKENLLFVPIIFNMCYTGIIQNLLKLAIKYS
tara:strand:- start:368 stop:763 length:396 start_codon:yes stop_codon:yes gene_type:complete